MIHEVGRPASALRTNKGSVARERRGGPAGRGARQGEQIDKSFER